MKDSYKQAGLVLITLGVVIITSFLGGMAGSYYARSPDETANYVEGTVQGGFMGWDHYTYDRYRLKDYNLLESTLINDSKGFIAYLNDRGYAVQEMAVPEHVGNIAEDRYTVEPESVNAIYADSGVGYVNKNVVLGTKDLGCRMDEKLGRNYCARREISFEQVDEPVVSIIEYREYQG